MTNIGEGPKGMPYSPSCETCS